MIVCCQLFTIISCNSNINSILYTPVTGSSSTSLNLTISSLIWFPVMNVVKSLKLKKKCMHMMNGVLCSILFTQTTNMHHFSVIHKDHKIVIELLLGSTVQTTSSCSGMVHVHISCGWLAPHMFWIRIHILHTWNSLTKNRLFP